MIGIFDAILIIIIAGFVFYGFFFGLIRAIGTLAGVAAGAFVASHFYLEAFDYIKSVFYGYDNLGKVITFILLFTLVNRLTAWAFVLLDKTFHLISIIPFLKTINRLAGAFFGLIEGALIVGLVLYVSSRYSVIGHWFGNLLDASLVAPALIKITGIVTPLLSEALKKLQSVI